MALAVPYESATSGAAIIMTYPARHAVFDIKAIRDNPTAFDKGLTRRGLEPLSKALLEMDEARRAHLTCPEVRAFEYFENGAIRRVEFVTPGDRHPPRIDYSIPRERSRELTQAERDQIARDVFRGIR